MRRVSKSFMASATVPDEFRFLRSPLRGMLGSWRGPISRACALHVVAGIALLLRFEAGHSQFTLAK
jgi:hypothetical protein